VTGGRDTWCYILEQTASPSGFNGGWDNNVRQALGFWKAGYEVMVLEGQDETNSRARGVSMCLTSGWGKGDFRGCIREIEEGKVVDIAIEP
jgi:hypothetical protein